MNNFRKLTAHTLAVISLITLSGVAAADSRGRVTPHERAELRYDSREVARNERQLERARYELYQAQRANDWRRVREARREIARERYELQQARLELRRDRWDAHR